MTLIEGFKRYKKKPLIIQAKQMPGHFIIETLEGKMKGEPGDYLIIGIKGERYPCKKEIFEESYDEVLPEKKKCEKCRLWGRWCECRYSMNI